ncbi:MAG: hypothetical protein ACK5TG_16130 [Planctomyces sp.]|nr:hypothetical protein [Planctomyces sp.]
MGRRRRSGGPTFSLFAFQDIITCVMGIMLLLTLMLAVELSATEVTSSQSAAEDSLQTLETESAELLTAIATLEQQLATQTETLRSGALLNPELLEHSHRVAIREAATSQEEAQRTESLARTSQQTLNGIRQQFTGLQAILEETQSLESQLAARQQELDQLNSGSKLVYNRHSSSTKFCWIIELDSPTQIRAGLMGDASACTKLQDVATTIEWIANKPAQDSSVMLLVKPGGAACLKELSAEFRRREIPYGFDLLPQDTTVLTAAGSKE